MSSFLEIFVQLISFCFAHLFVHFIVFLTFVGFMLENEREMLDSIKINFDKYWVPINWIYALIFRARKDGKIVSDSFTNKLCDVCFSKSSVTLPPDL